MSVLAAAIGGELEYLGEAGIAPFDVHSHTGTDVDGSSRSAAQQLAAIEPFGGRSAIFPFCVEGSYAVENQRVAREAAGSSDRLVAFARLCPRDEPVATAEAALAAGAQGIKLHPRAERFRLADPGVEEIFALAAAARVPVLIHAGTGVGSLGTAILGLAERHRGCPIVLAHAGVSDLAWLWPRVPQHPNLFFDTAWLVPPDLLALFALVPPGRILFGSDAPYMDFELVLAVTLRCARHAGLSKEALELILGGQLEALLAGGASVDAGPAPGPRAEAPTPAEARVAALLAAAGGCLLGGGDPTTLLELTALAAPGGGDPAEDELLSPLVGEARSGPGELLETVVFALAVASTPRRLALAT